jgi:hypothetical protein
MCEKYDRQWVWARTGLWAMFLFEQMASGKKRLSASALL